MICMTLMVMAVILAFSTIASAGDVPLSGGAGGSGIRLAPSGMIMQFGRGLGPYRIEMERTISDDLIRTIRQPQNDGGGCWGGFALDSYIDVYRGRRLGFLSGSEGRGYLDTIATTRKGDRASVGLIIGRSTLRDVRRLYPAVRVQRHLGGTTVSLKRYVGIEGAEFLTYGFDASKRLVRLETGVGGC
jgi:hypothetical protein